MEREQQRPLVITVAPTGMVPRQRDNISVPEQPDQIAADVKRAVEQGASCVHLHARDDEGEPTYRLEHIGKTPTRQLSEHPATSLC